LSRVSNPPSRSDRQHRAVVVVLALVDLTRLDAGETTARPVDGHADLAQHAPVRPVKDLRAKDDYRTVPAGCPEQTLKRFRGRLAVVVQQPDPLDAPDARIGHGAPSRAVPQRDRDGFPVARAPVHAEHRVVPDQLGEHRPAAVPAAGVHPHDPLDPVGLCLQRLDEPGQQASTVMRDDDRGNGMPGLGRGS
jgi:hypothetical protein